MDLLRLAPGLDRAEATRRLKRAPGRGFVLAKLVDFYVPFHLFETTVAARAEQPPDVYLYGLDAVNGTLDLYTLEGDEARLPLESERRLAVRRDPDQGESIVEERVLKLLFMSGIFGLKNPRITARATGELVHLPYWVGLYRKGDEARLEVLDARRGVREGVKLRELVEGWFRGEEPPAPVRTR